MICPLNALIFRILYRIMNENVRFTVAAHIIVAVYPIITINRISVEVKQ
jgi:hypothetical protein